MRVLLVEDDPEMVHLVSAMLERAGDQVLAADDIDDAIQLARGLSPELVLLDLSVDASDESMERFRETITALQTPIVLCTGARDGARLDAALRDGARGVVRKPFDPATFRDAVLRAMHGT